ncbi:serine/threonine protein kinase [Dasania marina]|uniref:serine/threonine protein kinase n=1 Tax=Dasania marina TaxID=471499 RepID=UPI00037C963E|nr:serine/threonine-protein kinase [Dasania marina]
MTDKPTTNTKKAGLDQPRPESDDDATAILIDDSLPTEVIPEGVEPTVIIEDFDATVVTSHDPYATVVNSPSSPSPQPAKASAVDGTITRNPLTNTLHKPFTMGGDAIKDRFIVQKVLGQGGMGMVCQALDLRKVEADDEQPHIAIKLLTGAFQQHASAFKSLQREAKKTQALAHPNIITVYDFDRDGDTIFMTMEELDGYPLDAILKGNTDVVLDRKTALKIIREIALALEYAHSKGIIHSDLKPGNIFYTNNGQTKVLDFGIARALNNELYKDNYDAGELNALTPKYASLEMFKGQQPDPRDDIYALGIIAVELLCGFHPYQGETALEVKAQALKPQLDKSLGLLYKKLLGKTLAVERENRTQTATRFISSLQWAEKGPRRLLITAFFVLTVLVANAFIIDAVDDDIPLSELPIADQTLVLKNLAEADIALKFKDYNGALVYLDRAYQVHPSNNDIEDKVDVVLDAFKAGLLASASGEQHDFFIKQLTEIGNYKFIANNDNYKDLLKEEK